MSATPRPGARCLLAGGGGIFLPGVGSLYTERQGARRLNRRTVLPPSRTVAFTSQQRGVSLVDEIARVMREAGGYENPEAEAQAVYDRWIARADLLTVEGVGELKFKNFIPDEAFDLRLNPQGREPVRVRVQRRFDWPLWVGIAAIVIAAGFGGAEFLRINSSDIPEPGAAAEVARTLPAADAGIPADSSATAGVTDDGTATAVAGTKAAETDVAGSSAAGAAGTAGSAGDRAGGAGASCGCQTCRTASRVGGTGLHGACIARFGTPVCRVGGFQYAGKCGPGRRGCRSQGCIGTLRGLPFRQ